MNRLFAAPIAKLFKLDLPLHELLVFPGRVIHVLARAAAEPDEFFGEFSLCHSFNKVTDEPLKVKILEPGGRIELPTPFLP